MFQDFKKEIQFRFILKFPNEKTEKKWPTIRRGKSLGMTSQDDPALSWEAYGNAAEAALSEVLEESTQGSLGRARKTTVDEEKVSKMQAIIDEVLTGWEKRGVVLTEKSLALLNHEVFERLRKNKRIRFAVEWNETSPGEDRRDILERLGLPESGHGNFESNQDVPLDQMEGVIQNFIRDAGLGKDSVVKITDNEADQRDDMFVFNSRGVETPLPLALYVLWIGGRIDNDDLGLLDRHPITRHFFVSAAAWVNNLMRRALLIQIKNSGAV